MNAYSTMQPESVDDVSAYVSPKLRHAIITGVIFVHLCVLVIPGIVLLIAEWVKPPEVKVARVSLVDSAPFDHKIPSRNPGKSPIPNNDPIAAPPKLPDMPPSDIPQPKTITEPDPIPQPKVQPRVQVKPQPKTTPQPRVQVKTPPKVQTPSKTPVPSPKASSKPVKKWQPLRDDQLNFHRSTGSSKGKTQTTPQRSGTGSSASRSTAYSKLAQDIRKDLKESGGGGGPLGKYDPTVDDYYARVQAYLRRYWTNQPNVSALGGKRPVVRVDFRVDASGRILSRQMHKCGNPVMDNSVEAFLRNLNKLPPPPKGQAMSFYVTMRVEDF